MVSEVGQSGESEINFTTGVMFKMWQNKHQVITYMLCYNYNAPSTGSEHGIFAMGYFLHDASLDASRKNDR